VAKHLDQPVREANDEEGHQQRAVEEVHGGEAILTARWTGNPRVRDERDRAHSFGECDVVDEVPHAWIISRRGPYSVAA
jgi:hypothetical protein